MGSGGSGCATPGRRRLVRGGFVPPRSSGARTHGRVSFPACICEKNKRVTNCRVDGGVCWCDVVGSGATVNCSTREYGAGVRDGAGQRGAGLAELEGMCENNH